MNERTNMDINSSTLVAIAFGALIAYGLANAFHRLFLHPLSKFPGPKLAACTLWYEFYYDVIKEGQWMFRIEEMHKKYGPIVRINPYELHIKDSQFYDEIYAPAGGYRKRNKYGWWCGMAAAPGSMFATVDSELHRQRRAPVNNFFSKKSVSELEPLLRQKVEKLCSRLATAVQYKQVVRVDCAFMALTMDIICSYCFGADRQYLDSDDFGLEWKETINGAWEKGGLLRHFPSMASFMRGFPRGLAKILDPGMSLFLAWQDSVKAAVEPIVEYRDGRSKTDQRTIFHALRDSDLPPHERTVQRLSEEGEIFTGAGSETTAKTLTTILYYLSINPTCLKRLQDELASAEASPNELAPLAQLEQLPYLSAVIQEGLRLSYGITTRLPRVASEPLQYKEWSIPAGTPVSETIYFVLMDPTIFPEPDVFRPERWIEDGQHLSKHQVSFNKGGRQCIGINLAYAEMYLACAAVFRRFNFELFETDFRSMEMKHDFFVAAPARENRGVKVKVDLYSKM